jgi:hypothetical protein
MEAGNCQAECLDLTAEIDPVVARPAPATDRQPYPDRGGAPHPRTWCPITPDPPHGPRFDRRRRAPIVFSRHSHSHFSGATL